MKDYGIKVVVAGKDVSSTDVRDLILSSKYSMLKYHLDTSGQITINIGDTNKYVDFTHGLDYIPAFIAYQSDDSISTIIPYVAPGGSHLYPYAYVDSTKVRCGISYPTPYGESTINTSSDNDYYDDHWGVPGFIVLGQKDGSGRSGALRFQNITINKNATIISASLDIAVEYKGAGSGDMKIRTLGIDEDNTSDFSSSPMGRSETSAVTTQNVSLPSTGVYFGINVKDQVSEITSRSGWSSGNSIGFKIFDNSSPSEVYVEDDYPGGIDSKLTIQTGSSQTFTFKVVIFKDKIA